MKQSNIDIENMMDGVLKQHFPSVPFDSIWEGHQKSMKRTVKAGRALKVPVAAIIACTLLFSVAFGGYAYFRNIDKTDYPFVDDPQVIGKWQAVDFVDEIGNFSPGKKSFEEDMYLSQLAFVKGGRLLFAIENGNLTSLSKWTKGLILNEQDKTAERYKIKVIDGVTYLFMEWKSGDYIFRNMDPRYYVLKQVDSRDYSDHQDVVVREDKVDYPFTDNPRMIGKWESVDFVKSIDSFNAGEKSWLDVLFLVTLDIRENGNINVTTTAESFPLRWTDDLIINKYEKTASRCTIEEIDGETYMFFEWKSGDYTYRGMDPYYYVLKKSE